MKGLLGAALVETALVTWRDLKDDRIPPLPSDYVAVAIIYGGLALFPDSASTFTSLVGWGLVAATVMRVWSPTRPLSPLVAAPLAEQTRQQQPNYMGPLPALPAPT